MSPTQIGLLAVAALVVLFAKGYLGNPFKSASKSKSDVLGREFLKAIQAEAQDEVAAAVAARMKEDWKAKLLGPFGGETKPPVPPPS